MPGKILLLSTSTIHGSSFLEYCLDEVKEHFSNTDEILFVPFARPSGISHDEYTELVRGKLELIGKTVRGIHEFDDPLKAVEDAKGIYVGGGNTFLLLRELYNHQLLEPIKRKVTSGELRYMGSSAGTNVACQTINNTNDMPIVYPPSFNAIGLVPFNVNPHYLDPDPNSKHKGETRETRINEFHTQERIPVVGLREGSWLKIYDDKISLGGELTARIFRQGEEPAEMSSEEDFSFLMG